MRAERYIVNVEGAVVRDGRYLMIVRSEQVAHAPGILALPGGKVEGVGNSEDVLEATLRREITEEVGVEIHGELEYVESKSFVADDGDIVVDVVFLCRYKSGAATVVAPAEIAEVRWMTAAEVAEHPRAPAWTRRSVALAEARWAARGW